MLLTWGFCQVDHPGVVPSENFGYCVIASVLGLDSCLWPTLVLQDMYAWWWWKNWKNCSICRWKEPASDPKILFSICFLIILSKVTFWLAPATSRHFSVLPLCLAEWRWVQPSGFLLAQSLLLLLRCSLAAVVLAFSECYNDVAQVGKVSGCVASWRGSPGWFSALPSMELYGGEISGGVMRVGVYRWEKGGGSILLFYLPQSVFIRTWIWQGMK